MENMHTDVRVLRAKGVTPSLRKVKQTTEATATRKKNIILEKENFFSRKAYPSSRHKLPSEHSSGAGLYFSRGGGGRMILVVSR